MINPHLLITEFVIFLAFVILCHHSVVALSCVCHLCNKEYEDDDDDVLQRNVFDVRPFKMWPSIVVVTRKRGNDNLYSPETEKPVANREKKLN